MIFFEKKIESIVQPCSKFTVGGRHNIGLRRFKFDSLFTHPVVLQCPTRHICTRVYFVVNLNSALHVCGNTPLFQRKSTNGLNNKFLKEIFQCF